MDPASALEYEPTVNKNQQGEEQLESTKAHSIRFLKIHLPELSKQGAFTVGQLAVLGEIATITYITGVGL